MKSAFDSAFEIVKNLTKEFKQGEAHYLSTSYQEAEARKDFIDKLLIALGWDVNHDTQHNPYEQEVKVEKTQSNQKRTDYSIYLSPNFKDPKFFVEAKKPAQNIKNADNFFQTIRYGWNANTPIALLTDFENFHILDCRYRPDINNVLTNPNHKQYHYSEFSDSGKFAEIYWLFSREAVANTSLEKYADTFLKLKGKSIPTALVKDSIDESFLKYIDEMRETLAKAFKKNDMNLTSEELTEATQRTIDRLVFIRFLEDKLIEQENYVSEFAGKGNAWAKFINACRVLDAKYNGIVFKGHFIDKKDFNGPEATEFTTICNDISHLNSPYDFNAIPIHILGSIYERFLGKVVHATDKRVKVEEKPEVRKAGGVYYTPKYIVDYIVDNTIGKLIEGKTSEQISKLRFIDIACGSGSFLIGVFECLLDYHRKYYQQNPDRAEKDGSHLKDGMWVLSIKQKKNILRNNIYGVDIDQQAVEVTQLSLALKMLEDETTATANDMQVMFHQTILPDMSKNIVCGNSLIGTDILTEGLFNGEEERRLNPMDFANAFPEIMLSGGFDSVVGNPPYIQQSMYDWFDDNVKQYLLQKYCSSMGRLNTFGFFIERAISSLKKDGKLGYIVPNTILTQEYYEKLRNLILDKTFIEEVVSYEHLPFKDAVVETTTLILSRNINPKGKTKLTNCTKDLQYSTRTISQELFKENYKHQIIVTSDSKSLIIKNKIRNQKLKLGDVVHINQGIALKFDRASYVFDKQVSTKYKPILDGREINKYELDWHGKYLKYDINAIHSCKREDIFLSKEKIFFRRVSASIVATLDTERFYALNTIVVMNLIETQNIDIKFVLGVFNSKFFNWYYITFLKSTKKVFSEIQARQVAQIPFPEINIQVKTVKAQHDQMVQFVDQMLSVKKELQIAKTDKDKTYFENKCNALEKQIDSLVYELYGLTAEEIKIVEGVE